MMIFQCGQPVEWKKGISMTSYRSLTGCSTLKYWLILTKLGSIMFITLCCWYDLYKYKIGRLVCRWSIFMMIKMLKIPDFKKIIKYWEIKLRVVFLSFATSGHVVQRCSKKYWTVLPFLLTSKRIQWVYNLYCGI